MKLMKPLVASILAAGLTGSALATPVYVHIVGAPAFRQNSNDAITAIAAAHTGGGLIATNAGTTDAAAVESAKGNQWLIPNYPTAGTDTVISATYPGSTASIETVAALGGATQKFIADGSTGTVASPKVSQSIGTLYAADNTFIALPDTYQGSTIFHGNLTYYSGANSTSPVTRNYQTLNATQIGVEPYRWVVSPGAPASFTNLTTAQAKALYSAGSLPLAFFTGNNADEGTFVFALSRDGGSGARIGALTEIGHQVPGQEIPIVSYQPVVTGGTTDGAGSNVGGTIAIAGSGNNDPANNPPPLYAVGPIPSTGVYDNNAGDAGYPSFGTTDQAGELLAVTSTAPAGYLFVAYLNIADSNEAAAAGARILTYNGVPYSTTAVAEGQYTFWAYEWLDKPASQSAAAAAFSTALIAQFPTNAAVPVSALNVSRSADGGPISGNYY